MRKTAAVLAITIAFLVSPSGTTYARHLKEKCISDLAQVVKNKWHNCRGIHDLSARFKCTGELNMWHGLQENLCGYKWKTGHSADYGKIDPQGRPIEQ